MELNLKQFKLKHMKNLIKLTDVKTDNIILIGTQSIISVSTIYYEKKDMNISKIQSRGAMVETFYVIESIEKIYNLYNS